MPKFKFRRTTKGLERKVSLSGPEGVDIEFIRAVKTRQYKTAFALMEHVSDINIKDAQTGAAALNFAAARSAIPLLNELEKQEGLDYLVRDNKGRYPSELAWYIAKDQGLGNSLQLKEKRFASDIGQKAWPKPDIGD